MTIRVLAPPILAGAFLLSYLAVAAPAFGQTPDTVFLNELTWTELRDLIHSGKTTAIIPIGGTEENGPQMALGKHNVRVKILSERIARALGNALVAPVIAYVPEGHIHPPTGHMGFPGTITIPEDAYVATLIGAARSMKAAGFRDIVFLGDHGGYQRLDQVVAERLNRRWAKSDVRATAMHEYYEASYEGFNHILAQHGLSKAEIGTHAAVADTSLTLAVAPSLVRQNLLKSGRKFGPKDGVYGDPTKSSAALGELGVREIVARTVAAIKKAVARR
jgi:creatinine amidohydrolase/Fe(II)-dependent formamide hydrolase-like protein